MPETDKLEKYSSFCVANEQELFAKTTKEGWDLVQVLSTEISEEVVRESINPHPPPAGYVWPDRNVYAYEKPKGWTPTIEVRTWEPSSVTRFLLGKNEEKLKIDLAAAGAELAQAKRDIESMKGAAAGLQETLKRLTDEKYKITQEMNTVRMEVEPLRSTNQRQERELNLKEAQILRYEKELLEYAKLLPPPSAGQHERKVDVDAKDPEIPF